MKEELPQHQVGTDRRVMSASCYIEPCLVIFGWDALKSCMIYLDSVSLCYGCHIPITKATQNKPATNNAGRLPYRSCNGSLNHVPLFQFN